MRAALLLLVIGLPALAQPTATFVYDAKSAAWPAGPEGLAARLFRAWAEDCRIAPGGGLVVLECPKPLEIDDPQIARVDTRLVLFRDLDETVRLAGCPDLDSLERDLRRIDALRDDDPDAAGRLTDEVARTKELCAEIEPGQTFTTTIDGDRLLIVARGRQLAFTLFRSEPKPREIRTPYEPAPTRGSLPHRGPPTQRTTEPNPAPAPDWDPARVEQPLARPDPIKTSKRSPGPAKTDLRTAAVQLTCSSDSARISVDGVALGAAPINTPLIAGPHTVEARVNGRAAATIEIEVEAGESLELDVCKSR